MPLISTPNHLKHPFSLIYSPQSPESTSALPFPPKSRGFLYYVPKTTHDVSLSGQVRFRLCRKDFVFAKGVRAAKKDSESDDLRFPTSTRRWNVPLLMILNYARYSFLSRLYDQLLADNFVSPELKERGVEALESALGSGRTLHIADNMIFSPSEPFIYDFGQKNIRLWKVKDGRARCLVFENPMRDPRPDMAFMPGQGKPSSYPYEGEAIARIETFFGVACIRLVRVISLSLRPAIGYTGPGTGSLVPLPKAGQLVMRWDHTRAKPALVPFTCHGLDWEDEYVPEEGEVLVGRSVVTRVVRKYNRTNRTRA